MSNNIEPTFDELVAQIEAGNITHPLGRHLYASQVRTLKGLFRIFNETKDTDFPTTITAYDFFINYPVASREDLALFIQMLIMLTRTNITVTLEDNELSVTYDLNKLIEASK